MIFSDGEESGRDCPDCGSPLAFEMSFQDNFNPESGHYTTDVPLEVCSDCNFNEPFEYEEEYYKEDE